MNKTLYIRPEDLEIWKKAERMLAFYEGKSVSEFCNEKIHEKLKELEKKFGVIKIK